MKKDVVHARKIFTQLLANSEINGVVRSLVLLRLGTIYKKGQCVARNFALGIKYFKDILKIKDADTLAVSGALRSLGEMHFYGDGVTKNVPKALVYFERVKNMTGASNFNLYKSLRLLGETYFFAHSGIERDNIKARDYLLEAVAVGKDVADSLRAKIKQILGDIYFYSKDYKMARKYLRKALKEDKIGFKTRDLAQRRLRMIATKLSDYEDSW